MSSKASCCIPRSIELRVGRDADIVVRAKALQLNGYAPSSASHAFSSSRMKAICSQSERPARTQQPRRDLNDRRGDLDDAGVEIKRAA